MKNILVFLLVKLVCYSIAQNVFPDKEWVLKTPSEVGFDEEKLKKNLAKFKEPIGIYKNGYQIYTIGDVTKPINTYSCSKSWTSIVFGYLQNLGKLDYDDIVPGSDFPKTPKATFREMLTMTSDYGLIPHDPGKHYAYNNMGVHHYGSFMQSVFFEGDDDPAKILDIVIFNVTKRQDPLTFQGLWSGWGGGWKMSVRDMARIGWLIFSEGKWEEKIVLSKSDYVDTMYENQISLNTTPNWGNGTNTWWNQWNITKKINNNYSWNWWVEKNAVAALGYQGKKLIIVPDHNLVISSLPIYNESLVPSTQEYVDAVVKALI